MDEIREMTYEYKERVLIIAARITEWLDEKEIEVPWIEIRTLAEDIYECTGKDAVTTRKLMRELIDAETDCQNHYDSRNRQHQCGIASVRCRCRRNIVLIFRVICFHCVLNVRFQFFFPVRDFPINNIPKM